MGRAYRAITAVVLAVSCALAWAQARPPALTDSAALLPEHRAAAAAVATFLTQKGENPKEFFAKIERAPSGKELVFHLWHQTAFEPQNRNVVGNPGGKNRDVYFDISSGTVSRMLFWQ
jgi:hypothetical protein